MQQYARSLGAAITLFALSQSAGAVEVELYDWGFNIDGSTYCNIGPCDNAGGGTLPASVNASAFDFGTGFGSLVVTIDGAGSHSVDFFADIDIDAAINTYFNEIAVTGGALAAGESYEIDEPGYVFGDIWSNFLDDALDNSNGLLTPEDVSAAFGWDFVLDADEVATIQFLVSDVMPTSGFFIAQTDPDSDYTLYLTSSLQIEGGGGGVPEPGTVVLIGIGLLGLAGVRRMAARGERA
jgi:PEP-CTERM motif